MEQNCFVDFYSGELKGDIVKSETRISDLSGFFENEKIRASMDQDQIIYHVEAFCPERDGTEGGLFFGTSYLLPGLVGDEYYMTKGHFHQVTDTAEFYWCIKGEGFLLLMDEARNVSWTKLSIGKICYIPRKTAHRLVNTGDEILTVGACWPSNAGHDYGKIRSEGFAARVKKIHGSPQIVIQS